MYVRLRVISINYAFARQHICIKTAVGIGKTIVISFEITCHLTLFLAVFNSVIFQPEEEYELFYNTAVQLRQSVITSYVITVTSVSTTAATS